MIAARPKFSQQRFDHMWSLIRKVKDRALTRGDLDTDADVDLLDALLLRFRKACEVTILAAQQIEDVVVHVR
jgi:hypothetical protein